MQSSGKSLFELKSGMAKYPQTMINVRIGNREHLANNPAINSALRDAEAALGSKGRVLLRPSGTEPVVRVMVEGVDGALVGFATFIPGLINDLWQAVQAGDLKKAMQIQAVITPLKDAVYGGGEPTGEAHARMKMGMYLAGVIDAPTVRPPTEMPSDAETNHLRAAVANAGLLKR